MGNTQVRPGVVDVSRHHVAGLAVVPADIDRALEALWDDAATNALRVYALVNAYSATLRRQSPAYASVLEAPSTVPLPDGAGLSFGAVLVGLGWLGRCPGPDLLEAAAARAAEDGTRFYLLGGGEGVAERLRDALVGRYPDLCVVGVATPPYGDWSPADSALLCADIRRASPDIVWLGVSAPKQEIWSMTHLASIGAPVVCVGAAFDFLSGLKPRAPKWVRSIGMEWFFRLCSEPSRLWRRYIVGNLVFLADLARFRAMGPGCIGRPSA